MSVCQAEAEVGVWRRNRPGLNFVISYLSGLNFRDVQIWIKVSKKHLVEVFKWYGFEHGQNYYKCDLIVGNTSSTGKPKTVKPSAQHELDFGQNFFPFFFPFKVSSAQRCDWKLYTVFYCPFVASSWAMHLVFASYQLYVTPPAKVFYLFPKQLKTFDVSAFVVHTSKLWNKLTELFKSAELLT